MLKQEKTEIRLIAGHNKEARIYKNQVTGGECVTYLLTTDKLGNKWWAFEDLFTLPFIRQLTAKKVTDLYGHGLALEDIKALTGQIKTILRSADGEKYDKAMAKVLELENISETMADPVKQCMGLCTVYLLLNDEMPDAYSNGVTAQKMTIMATDLDLQAFFLSWWTGIMSSYGQHLKALSRIASIANQSSGNNTGAQSS